MAPPQTPSAIAADALRLVARASGPAALTSALHTLGRQALGAHVSLVVQPVAGGADYRVASAEGLDQSPLDAWLTSPQAAGAAGRAIAHDGPIVIAALAREVPELAASLGAASAVLAPLVVGDGPPGLLLLGFSADVPPVDLVAVAAVADAFALGLERTRLERESELERDLRTLVPSAVAQGYPAAFGPALRAFCRSLAWLVGADAAEIWQHDRLTRELVLTASSDGASEGTRLPTADQESPAARGLRQQHAEMLLASGAKVTGTGLTLTAPLKGRRRALGALVLTGVRLEAGGDADLVARVDQIARGLATSLENVQLLDDVVRSRQELDHLASRLAQTERLLALGQFVAGIAHELNNPLQGVLGHLELLRASPLSPELKRDLALVHREAARAARIVSNLMVFAGSGRLRVRAMNLNTLVIRVLRLRARALRTARIEVVRDLAGSLPLVRADALLLQQAILNVVVNAEQAMAGPGRLTLHTAVDDGGERVRLAIEDTGPGLTPDVRSRLFEPFFTTKDVGKGTGMGLAIAFGILRAHGGAIEADDNPAGGARFTLSLPVAPLGAKMKRAPSHD